MIFAKLAFQKYRILSLQLISSPIILIRGSVISGVWRILIRGGGEHLATKRLSRAPAGGPGAKAPPPD